MNADLLGWFAGVRRELPWRDSDDLYGIWVSEIMLQQTTVQAVIPFWQRFLVRFPTVADLAAAPEAKVLEAWSGLGYYTRARNLHAAARTVCRDHGGVLPRTRAQWAALPGVGPYASGAIASIGLGERCPALDANARRVLLRLAGTDPAAIAALRPARRQRLVDELGLALVPETDPGAWNEALMELGALICGARRTACPECPVRGHCRARQGDWVAEMPPPVARSSAEPVWCAQLVISWRGSILLVPPGAGPLPVRAQGRLVVRDDFSGLHGGLWGLPATVWLAGHEAPLDEQPDWLPGRVGSRLGQPPLDLPVRRNPADGPLPYALLGHFRHAITRYRLRVAVYQIVLDPHFELPAEFRGDAGTRNAGNQGRSGLFCPPAGPRPPVSRLTEKALHFHMESLV